MKFGGEKRKKKKMSLEDYVDFFTSGRSVVDFTISYLNQIIRMHGFRMLHKSHKKTVGEAVDALDLIDPSRSTLNQITTVSSSSLTLDEVITDIEALKWQECCFTSLQIINSEDITRSVPKPNKKKSNKRKKATTMTKSGDENGTTTMISFPAFPRKIRTKKTMNEAPPPSKFTTIP